MWGRENPRRIVMRNNDVDELRKALQVVIELLVKNENEDLVIEQVESISSEKNNEIKREKMINYIMKNVGIPASILGYKYVIRSIELVLNGKVEKSVTKELYPIVAKEFKTTSSRVERAIRHAVEVSMDNGNMDFIEEIFGYSFSIIKGKPTNSEFIYGIVDYINLQERIDALRNGNL